MKVHTCFLHLLYSSLAHLEHVFMKNSSLPAIIIAYPFIKFEKKNPAYPFIRAYPFIIFDEKVQPARLLEPTLLLER